MNRFELTVESYIIDGTSTSSYSFDTVLLQLSELPIVSSISTLSVLSLTMVLIDTSRYSHRRDINKSKYYSLRLHYCLSALSIHRSVYCVYHGTATTKYHTTYSCYTTCFCYLNLHCKKGKRTFQLDRFLLIMVSNLGNNSSNKYCSLWWTPFEIHCNPTKSAV